MTSTERRSGLTPEYVKSILDYDPKSGNFTWLVSKKARIKGRIAGSITKFGYRRLMINQIPFSAHRVAWFVTHGRWPIEEIDHKDRNRSNNSIVNLREATRRQNRGNINPNAWGGKSGLRGIRKYNGKWKVQIGGGNRQKHLGTFATKEGAIKRYNAAAKARWGEYYTPQLAS